MICLDYSANTPVDPAVLTAFCQAEQNFIGNPNSVHCAGREAKKELDRVTDSIAALLGISSEEVIYTSGASESNNLAIKGIAQASRHTGRHIISTSLEHASVGGSLTALQQQGCEVPQLPLPCGCHTGSGEDSTGAGWSRYHEYCTSQILRA